MNKPENISSLEKVWDDIVTLENNPEPGTTLRGLAGRAGSTHREPVSESGDFVTTCRNTVVVDSKATGFEIRSRKIAASESAADSGNADFTILDELGRGGMGVVFNAWQGSLERAVAVKMLSPDLAGNTGASRKMISEALVIGELDHPNIVPIYELGCFDGDNLFYAMKTVKGDPWAARISSLSLYENVNILMRVADAAAFAHARGILHRDLKPGNVMLGDFGEVLLMDWGLAVSLRPSAKVECLNFTNAVAGTPAYMSPEMAVGNIGKISERSDVYLLGAILFEILTGTRPHRGEDSRDCLRAAAANEIVHCDSADDLLPVAFKAMAADPDERYASVKDFQNSVREVEQHRESKAMASSAEEHLARAVKTDSYAGFAQAVFAFREAVKLWPGNEPARAGEIVSRKKYAACAFAKMDYDLAQDNLDGLTDKDSLILMVKVRQARHELQQRKKRLRFLTGVALVMTGIVLATLTVSVVMVTDRVKSEQKARERARLALIETTEARERENLAALERERALEREKEALLRERGAREERIAALARAEEERRHKEKAEKDRVALADAMSRRGQLEDASWWSFGPAAAVEKQRAASSEEQPVRLDVPVAGEFLSFMLVPSGEFAMGSSPRSAWHNPDEYLHRVVIGNHFYLGRTEITRAQWRAVVGIENAVSLLPPYNPSLRAESEEEYRDNQLAIWGWRTRPLEPDEEKLPATGISPEEIDALFLPVFASAAPRGWRAALPSEAQWEYAARSGDAGAYFGHVAERQLDLPGWTLDNSGMVLHETGLKAENAWGLADMHGNAGEVVFDAYARDYYLSSPVRDPMNTSAAPFRVYRGGNVMHPGSQSLSGSRHRIHRQNRYSQIGFRLSLQPE